MFSRVITKRSIGIRSLHKVPKLENVEEFANKGISGLYTPKQFKMSWIDYQNYLLTNLTLLTKGTSFEPLQTYQTLLRSAKRTTDQHIFHYASQAHNNHLFFQQLTNKQEAQTTKPSRLIMQKLLQQDISDLPSLKQKIVELGTNTFGQGWIFLVEYPDKQIKLMRTYNDGTPYYYGKSQVLDLNGAIDESTFNYLENLKQRVVTGEKEFTLPVVAISLWDHAYIHDYGVNGKEQYLENVVDCINWNVVNKRLFII